MCSRAGCVCVDVLCVIWLCVYELGVPFSHVFVCSGQFVAVFVYTTVHLCVRTHVMGVYLCVWSVISVNVCNLCLHTCWCDVCILASVCVGAMFVGLVCICVWAGGLSVHVCACMDLGMWVVYVICMLMHPFEFASDLYVDVTGVHAVILLCVV